MQSYVIRLWFRRKPVAENKPNPAPWPPRCPPSMTPCKQRGHPNTSAGACVSPQGHPSHPRLCKTPLLQVLVLPSLLRQKKGTEAKLATHAINVLHQEFGANSRWPPRTGSPSPPSPCVLLYPADRAQPQVPVSPGCVAQHVYDSNLQQP